MLSKKILCIFIVTLPVLIFSNSQVPFNNERKDRTTQEIVIPSMIVVHYSCHENLDVSILALKYNNASVHYMIDIDGNVYQTIDGTKNLVNLDNFCTEQAYEYLKKRAFHAGHSYFKNSKNVKINDVNSHSIGIMFVNQGATPKDNPEIYTDKESDTKWYTFTQAQQRSFIKLCLILKKLYPIHDKDIIGHGECAINPTTKSLGRKIAPGPLFPWKHIAQKGVGIFHTLSEQELEKSCSIEIIDLQQQLESWGYSIPLHNQNDSATHQAIIQAQIHHDPHHINGNCQSCRLYYIMKNLHQQHQKKMQS